MFDKATIILMLLLVFAVGVFSASVMGIIWALAKQLGFAF